MSAPDVPRDALDERIDASLRRQYVPVADLEERLLQRLEPDLARVGEDPAPPGRLGPASWGGLLALAAGVLLVALLAERRFAPEGTSYDVAAYSAESVFAEFDARGQGVQWVREPGVMSCTAPSESVDVALPEPWDVTLNLTLSRGDSLGSWARCSADEETAVVPMTDAESGDTSLLLVSPSEGGAVPRLEDDSALNLFPIFPELDAFGLRAWELTRSSAPELPGRCSIGGGAWRSVGD